MERQRSMPNPNHSGDVDSVRPRFAAPDWTFVSGVALAGVTTGLLAGIAASGDDPSATWYLWPLMPVSVVAGELWRKRRRA